MLTVLSIKFFLEEFQGSKLDTSRSTVVLDRSARRQHLLEPTAADGKPAAFSPSHIIPFIPELHLILDFCNFLLQSPY
jgi:hypothetical protein